MDTAGKAVLFSGRHRADLALRGDARAGPAFRSMALGIMLSVAFILLATLTLLPAVLAWLGDRVDRLALPWVHAGEHRSPRFERWGELWRRPALLGIPALVLLVALALPVLRLDTGMPSIKVVPSDDGSRVGYAGAGGVRPGRAGTLQVVGRLRRLARAERPRVGPGHRRRHTGAAVGRPRARARRSGGDPSDPSVGATIERSGSARRRAPRGAAAENHDLEEALAAKTLPSSSSCSASGSCCSSSRSRRR